MIPLYAPPSYKLWKVSEGDFWKARNSGLRDVYIDYINSKIPLKDYKQIIKEKLLNS